MEQTNPSDAATSPMPTVTRSGVTSPDVWKAGAGLFAQENLVLHGVLNLGINPVMAVIGLLGNALIVVVMAERRFKKLPLRIYLSVLAVFDSLALVTVGVKQFLRYSSQIEVYRMPVLCNVMDFLLTLGVSMSGWTLVCLAAERTLVVILPLKAKQLTSQAKAGAVLAVITCIQTFLSAVNFWMTDYPSCLYQSAFMDYFRIGKGLVVLIVYNMLPLGIIGVCYTVLVVMVMRARKKRLQALGPGTGSQQSTELITAMCIYTCLAFLVLTGPASVYVMLSRQNGWNKVASEQVRVAQSLVMNIRQLSYATNFIIYLATNKQFRAATVRVLWKRGQVAPETETKRSSTLSQQGPAA